MQVIKAEQYMISLKAGNVSCLDASSCAYLLVLYDKIIIIVIFPLIDISVTSWIIHAIWEEAMLCCLNDLSESHETRLSSGFKF